ncbi:plasmid partition family protein [Borreliella lusitaniae]|uniref:plasmid partition family protein n=1 Tax=Borreliella lusitaniae TaxID=100177 RepID=UPI0026470FB1|nr:plasmid partition family protein [Borreliella lusitaniae]WKC84855.1 plasmid partition family protein [Borreliella lusitaniae]
MELRVPYGTNLKVYCGEKNEIISNSKSILNRSFKVKIEDEKSFDFYKSNTNFVSFLLKELYYDNQKLLTSIKNKYENLKNKK